MSASTVPSVVCIVITLALGAYALRQVWTTAQLDDHVEVKRAIPPMTTAVGIWELSMALTLLVTNGWRGIGSAMLVGTLGGALLFYAKLQRLSNRVRGL